MADVLHYWGCFLQCVTASGVAAQHGRGRGCSSLEDAKEGEALQ